MSVLKTYRVSIPVMVVEEPSADDLRIISSAADSPHNALMIGFHIRATNERDAALILYERLEGVCGDS
jgi:hypothetical protein